MQSLALDIKVFFDDDTEVNIIDSSDYEESGRGRMNRENDFRQNRNSEDVDGDDNASEYSQDSEYEEDGDYEDNDEYSYEDDYQNDLDEFEGENEELI